MLTYTSATQTFLTKFYFKDNCTIWVTFQTVFHEKKYNNKQYNIFTKYAEKRKKILMSYNTMPPK